MLKCIIPFIMFFSAQVIFAQGYIQNEDVKSLAEIVSAGGVKAQLINASKIYDSDFGDLLSTLLVNTGITAVGSQAAGKSLISTGLGTATWQTILTPSMQANLIDVGIDGIVITGGTSAVLGTGTSIAQAASSGTQNGYLQSADWNTFNNKQNALGYTPVPNTTTVNGYALSSNVSLALGDLNNVLVPTPAVNDSLVWNGADWVNGKAPTSPSNGLIYYNENIASDIGGYFSFSTVPNFGTENDIGVAVTSGTSPVLIASFATAAGGLGVTSIPSGEWMPNPYAKVSAGATTTISMNFYKRTSGGVETLLFTCSPTQVLTTTFIVIEDECVQNSFAVNTTDRLVVKYYANNTSGTSRTVTMAFDGATYISHIHTPFTSLFSALTVTGNATIGGTLTIGTPLGVASGGTGVSSLGNLTDVGTDGITVTGGTGAVIGTGTSLSQHVADSTHAGYLSSTDWSTFNGKQASGVYITNLTGDVTANGPGSVAATVNAIGGTVVGGSTGTGNVVFSSNPTLTGNLTAGTFRTTGSTSGNVSIDSITGTYNFNLPTTAGTTGQVLTSQGGGASAMTWSPSLTNPMSAVGDMIYGGTAGAATALSGNITTTKKYLSQTGTGSASQAPTWAQTAFSDLSGSVATTQMPALTGDVTTAAGAVATSLVATSNSTLATLSAAAGVAVHGTNTNNSASAGYVGEYVESVTTNAPCLATALMATLQIFP